MEGLRLTPKRILNTDFLPFLVEHTENGFPKELKKEGEGTGFILLP